MLGHRPCLLLVFPITAFSRATNIEVVHGAGASLDFQGLLMQKSSHSSIFPAWHSAGAGPRGWCLGGGTELRCDVHWASSSWMRKGTGRMGRGHAAFGEMLLLGPMLLQWHPEALSQVTWQGRCLETA